ncbi:MAG: hypothetical protein QM613_00120 [Micrococcaceae bacterium]
MEWVCLIVDSNQENVDSAGVLSISRRTVNKGLLWSVPVVSTAVSVPAFAASVEVTDDVSILNYQVTVDSASGTANLVITNTDTAKKWVSDSLWAYHGVFTWSGTIGVNAPIIIDGVSGTRQLNRPLRMYVVYFNLESQGSQGIEPETALTLPLTLANGYSFTPTATDSVGVSTDIILTANGSSYYPGDSVPVGGNISITVYRE